VSPEPPASPAGAPAADRPRPEAAAGIRPAVLDDVPALLRLEQRCFETDRIAQRQFRYLISRANAATLVAEGGGAVVGYVIVLFSRGTSMARLYSIAVAPDARGRGLARRLAEAAETEAWRHHRAYMRLEVRKDNAASLALFTGLGYRRFGERADYYEDHMDAWRMEKTLAPDARPPLRNVPYYEQTLEFTCGPAALMMAMKTLQPGLALDRKLELRLWREATTIFMTSGHGGCGPFGLALAAARRGFRVEIFVSEAGVHLADSVRSEEKKEVIRLVQEDMEAEARALGLRVTYGVLSVDELKARFDAGAVPLVLISSWLIYGEKSPHWVVVTGFDDHFVYANDPFVDYDEGETPTDSIDMPIPRDQFHLMSRYGKAGLKAVVMLQAGRERSA
jgi:ribosomal protein S18 acetylase RimI-like enzyme